MLVLVSYFHSHQFVVYLLITKVHKICVFKEHTLLFSLWKSQLLYPPMSSGFQYCKYPHSLGILVQRTPLPLGNPKSCPQYRYWHFLVSPHNNVDIIFLFDNDNNKLVLFCLANFDPILCTKHVPSVEKALQRSIKLELLDGENLYMCPRLVESHYYFWYTFEYPVSSIFVFLTRYHKAIPTVEVHSPLSLFTPIPAIIMNFILTRIIEFSMVSIKKEWVSYFVLNRGVIM